MQNHGEIKEQQSLTLTGTRWQSCGCCFLCSGGFGCLARAAVSSHPLLLLSCCCVLCKSKVRPPGPAAHPLPPARPHSFGPPHFPKNWDFPEENFSRPEVFQSCTLGVAALVTAQFGDLCLCQSARFLDSRRRKNCGLPEISPRVSPLPSKQNSQQLSTAPGLTVWECQHDFAKSRGKVRSCL